ncbi:hypothetical protein XENTR_v10016814 [Xenopus tropicalis]|uniref:Uncharacterized protein LOC116411735 n=1 Tax=Xenopus tropicalis TaxID=8364 RepID=A0A8J1JRA6_XENTR|nr:uncharacterized protein LOC116411735 [Xenopus tropicalis]KAE8598395.1 hypothetical protein XENTR_v10016814 [Xenopus tropicalis]
MYFIHLPFWMLIFGLATLIGFHPASAAGITGLTLFTDKLQLNLHSWNLVPCRFYSDKPILPNQLHLEWGKTTDEGGTYIPLIQLFGENIKRSRRRHQVYINLVSHGNCSLVINPTKSMDSGIYEVRLALNGVLYEPVPKIRVQTISSEKTVRLQKRDETGETEEKTDENESDESEEQRVEDERFSEEIEKNKGHAAYVFLKYEKYYIISIVIMSLITLLGPVGWYLYYMELKWIRNRELMKESRKLPDEERGQVENIQKDTENEPKKQLDQNTVTPSKKPHAITKPKQGQVQKIQKDTENVAKKHLDQNLVPPAKESSAITKPKKPKKKQKSKKKELMAGKT